MIRVWRGVFTSTTGADPFSDHFLLYDRRRTRGRGGCSASSSAAAGAIVRKVLPAIGITIAVFVVVFVGLFPLRPHYAEPERLVIAVATRLCRTP
jgi:hypothetical protein